MIDEPDASPVVFLADSVEVEGAGCDAEDGLRWIGSELLPLAREATETGEALVDVGPALGGHVFGIPVRVHLGPSWTRGGSVAIPIRWEAVSFGSLFPVLDGTLLITSLAGDRCRLGIEASYRPPFDGVGRLLDRAILRRVAESTVRSFLTRTAQGLSGAARRSAPEPS